MHAIVDNFTEAWVQPPFGGLYVDVLKVHTEHDLLAFQEVANLVLQGYAFYAQE